MTSQLIQKGTKQIPLTRGMFAIVDTEDFDKLASYSWRAKVETTTDTFYAVTDSHKGGKHSIYMHRLIMGDPVGMYIDHINHNALDNRKENLRVVTFAQNMQNSRPSRTSKTGYKGVSVSGKKFCASIRIKNKQIHLGTFPTPESAALAYNEVAKKEYGEFAYLNILPSLKEVVKE